VINKGLMVLTLAASEEYGVSEYVVNIVSDRTDINQMIETKLIDY